MATTYLSPVGNSAQINANGSPLSGGQIWTYAAGTTNLIATYMDNSGSVGQQNPIPLNASGLPSNPIWLPAGQAVKLVIQDANGVTQRTVDNVTGINDPSGASTADQWVIYPASATFVNATSFSLGGDQTGIFHAGRRIKTVNTGGTVYSSISTSSYNSGTARTTVTVANDSGSLDAGLSQIAYGLLSFANSSAPVLASLGTTGWKKSVTGEIEQWGSGTTAAGVLAVSFPIAFQSALYTLMVMQGNNASATNATVDTTAVSLLGFTANTFNAATGAAINRAFFWRATGK